MITRLRQVACAFVLVLIGCSISCGDQEILPERLKGVLLFSLDSYNIETGKSDRISWPDRHFNPHFRCIGPGDTLLISSQWYPGHGITYGDDTVSGAPVFKWVPIYDAPIPVRELSDSSFWCWNLDYDQASEQYLFVGSAFGKKGTFLFDRDFALVRHLPTGFDRTEDCNIFRAYFLAPDSIVFGCNGIYIWDINDTPELIAPEMTLFTISNDRKKLMVFPGRSKKKELQIVHLDDLSTEHTSIRKKNFTGACFSPDDRYLAFAWQSYNLGNDVKLSFYDLTNGKVYDAPTGGYNLFVWLDSLPSPSVTDSL